MSSRRTIRLTLGRGWEDGPGAAAVAWSLLLHVLILAGLLVGSRRAPRPPDWMGARVRIVSALPEPDRALEALPALSPPSPEPERLPEPSPEPVSEPRLPDASPEPLAIGPRREPPEPAPKPDPAAETEPEPEPERPVPREAADSGHTVRTRAAAVRFEGQDVPHDAYLGSVVRRVSGQWLKPRTGLPPRPARIYFEIERTGRLSSVRIEQSSGVASFDRAALRAIRLAEPLPLLPPAYPHRSLKVHFDFIP